MHTISFLVSIYACNINLFMLIFYFLGLLLWAASVYSIDICSSSGKKSSSDSVPLPKIPDCIPEMKVRQILKNAEDSNHDLNRVCSNK